MGRDIREIDFGHLDTNEEGEMSLYVTNVSRNSIAGIGWKTSVPGLEIDGPKELFSGHSAPLTLRWKPGVDVLDAQVSVEGKMV